MGLKNVLNQFPFVPNKLIFSLRKSHYAIPFLFCTLFASCGNENRGIPSTISKPFPLDKKVQVLMPGLISTGLYERDLAISSDGSEMIYTLGTVNQDQRMLVSRNLLEDGTWTPPKGLPFSGIHQDIEPFFAPNSSRLYFASNRPISESDSTADYNIWYSEKHNDQWSEPVALPSGINTEKNEFFPSVTSEGHLYFTAIRDHGVGSEDIFKAEFLDGTFQTPVPLDTTINTKTNEFNAFISPEEDLIIFSSYGRKDDLGGGDLYYSTKTATGRWKQAEHLPAPINSEKLDYCPFVDLKSGILYFTSKRVIPPNSEQFTPESIAGRSANPGNGLGDIYFIALDSIPNFQ